MIVLIKLILAHFVGDFMLQPKSWVKEKEILKAKTFKLYLHILIHGLLVLLVLWDFKYWYLAIILMIIHGIIDTLKLYVQKDSNKSPWFLIDQGLHFISILGLWYVFFDYKVDLNRLIEDKSIWIYATALIFITIVSGIMIRELLLSWTKAIDESNEESLQHAGKYIGILERVFVFTFVITTNWEGIGFLLAAKSVFRFGDLKESKDRKLTEYILIGTLLSFGIAIAAGMLVLKLLEN